MIETFGRGSGKLAFEAARKYPPNFGELPHEEQRKIEEFGDAIMILVPEKPTTVRSLAAKAKEINKDESNVVVVVAEGFLPPELKYEMDRLAKNDTLRDLWISGELTTDGVSGLIEAVDENDPRVDLKRILEDRELAAQFGKTVWETKLDEFRNVAKVGGIRKFVIQALHKLADAKKVNELLENYEARDAKPTERDSVMGQKIGANMAELINEGVTGGKAVVYLEGRDPMTQEPVVVPLEGVSNRNNLNDENTYPNEILKENGVFWKNEYLSEYLKPEA